MKKLSVLILVNIIAALTWAGAVTVNFNFTSGYSNQQRVDGVKNSGVTITFRQNSSTTWPVWLESTACLRVYAKNGFTVESSTPIEGVEIEFKDADHSFINGNSAAPTVSAGTYSESDVIGTWEAEGTSLTLTAGGTKGHARINAIKVTLSGDAPAGSVPNPVITPASAAFSDSQTVSISCEDPEADIYYTLDESTPSTASIRYEAPFTVTETTTVKAIAVKGEAVSQVVTAVMSQLIGVESVAEYLGQSDGTMMVFNCPVIVIAQYEKHMFVQDEWGLGMRMFGMTGQTYSRGDVIPAGFTGTKTVYGAEPELSVFYTNHFLPATEKREPVPTLLDPTNIGYAYFADYVLMRNVTLGEGDEDGEFFILNEDEDYGIGYTRTLYVGLPADMTRHYDILGVVNSHYSLATIYQLCPTQFLLTGDLNKDDSVNAADVAMIYGILTGNNASDTPLLDEMRADLNGDGAVNAGDVAVLYGMIINQ